jgi:hypothetical protein
MGNGGKDVGRVGGGSLDAVSVVDATLSSLSVYIKPLEIIVKVNRSGTEISSEEGGVSGEYGGDIDSTFFAERQSYTGQPFMELDDNSATFLMKDIL